MAKVIFKDKKSLENVKEKMGGAVSYRQMKGGQVIAAKWPSKRKKLNK